eukprot:1779251-Heterocapsa_arctica.AAC.1
MSMGVGCCAAALISSAKSKRSHTVRMRNRQSPHEETFPSQGGGRATPLRSTSFAPHPSGCVGSPPSESVMAA